MPSCSALNCSNTTKDGFRLFRVPRDPERRKIWIINSRRDKWKITDNSCFCDAPPNIVKNEERHAAEQTFLTFSKSSASYGDCKNILQTSKEAYVLFQTASLLKNVIIRDWSLLNSDEIEELRVYLLRYIIDSVNLPAYVREELVHGIAVIYKRGSLDRSSNGENKLFSDVGQLIHSNNLSLQLIACSILTALLYEFSSSSRMHTIGFTWDMHMKCKIKFEHCDMKQVFIFCLHMLTELSKMSDLSTNQTSAIVGRFLSIAQDILNWEFSRKKTRNIGYFSAPSQSSSFEPPASWQDVLLGKEIINILFSIHRKIRNNKDLANQSLLCLAQLASINGDIFSNKSVLADYIAYFIQSFLMFVSEVELMDHEVLGVACIVKNLVTYTPMFDFLLLPQDLIIAFLSCLSKFTCGFCRRASQNDQLHSDNTVFMEAFDKTLEAWILFVNHASDITDSQVESSFRQHAKDIFGMYLQCHLAAPDGSRSNSSVEEYDETEEEDEIKYSDQLFTIGSFGQLVPDYSIPLLSRLLDDRIHRLQDILHKIQQQSSAFNGVPQNRSCLEDVNEDLHWLLLIATETLTESGSGGETPMIPSSIVQFSISQVDRVDVNSTVKSLVISDRLAGAAHSTDPIIRLVSDVFRLCLTEKQAIECNLTDYISPQVAASVLHFLSRFTCAYLIFDDSFYRQVSLSMSTSFGKDCESSSWIISFLLDKIESNLNAWSSEEEVTMSTLQLLTKIVDRKENCDVAIKCETLWNIVHNFSSNNHPYSILSSSAKKELCRALVLANSATYVNRHKEVYLQTILQSLHNRFKQIINRPDLSSVCHELQIKSDVQCILDCLSGVAEAVRGDNGQLIFSFLHPNLVDIVVLLDLYHNYEEVVQLVLRLFEAVTKHIVSFLSDTESVRLYEVCLSMMQVYAKHNQGRRVIKKDVEEDQFNDITSLMQILTNLLAKDFINFAADEVASESSSVSASDVVVYGLTILIPLLTVELLKFPILCSSYMSLLSYMSEIHVNHLCRLPEHLYTHMMASVEFAMTSQGLGVTKDCLEILSSLSAHILETKTPVESSIFAINNHFLKVIFNMLLLESFDVGLMESASTAFFSLICCHHSHYCELVNELLSHYSNSPFNQRLLDAFNCLTPPGLNMSVKCRTDKIKFMQNFDKFLVTIRGCLCVR